MATIYERFSAAARDGAIPCNVVHKDKFVELYRAALDLEETVGLRERERDAWRDRANTFEREYNKWRDLLAANESALCKVLDELGAPSGIDTTGGLCERIRALVSRLQRERDDAMNLAEAMTKDRSEACKQAREARRSLNEETTRLRALLTDVSTELTIAGVSCCDTHATGVRILRKMHEDATARAERAHVERAVAERALAEKDPKPASPWIPGDPSKPGEYWRWVSRCALRAERDSARTEVELVKAQLARRHSEYLAATSECNEFRAEVERLKEALAAMTEQWKTLQESYDTLLGDYRAADSMRFLALSAKGALECKLSEAQGDVERLTSECQRAFDDGMASARHKDLDVTLDTTRNERDSARAEVERLKKVQYTDAKREHLEALCRYLNDTQESKHFAGCDVVWLALVAALKRAHAERDDAVKLANERKPCPMGVLACSADVRAKVAEELAAAATCAYDEQRKESDKQRERAATAERERAAARANCERLEKRVKFVEHACAERARVLRNACEVALDFIVKGHFGWRDKARNTLRDALAGRP